MVRRATLSTGRFAGIVMCVGAAALLVVSSGRTSGKAPAPPPPVDSEWAALDAQARCESAAALVTAPDSWPTLCRWRSPGEGLQGPAFPPPKGPPPYDDPHIEIYVAPTQTREQLANAIAHELGHMHHTREPAFVSDYLAARNLPADPQSEIWTEDYAEVFAALFSPPADHWRAPTPRPSAEALAALKGRFFS